MFWRDTGINEEVEEVDARDTGGMTITDMMTSESWGRADYGGVLSGRSSRDGTTMADCFWRLLFSVSVWGVRKLRSRTHRGLSSRFLS